MIENSAKSPLTNEQPGFFGQSANKKYLLQILILNCRPFGRTMRIAG